MVNVVTRERVKHIVTTEIIEEKPNQGEKILDGRNKWLSDRCIGRRPVEVLGKS